ncbi:MAG TPA: DMT family transporter [Dongiaceae bacterium]|nr:DMT family transporter [Dongiaceae bacterium]
MPRPEEQEKTGRRIGNRVSPYLLLVLTTLFWAGNFVLARGVKTSIPPISLAFWRWICALVILLPFSVQHFQSQWPLVRKNWRTMALYGVMGVSCFNTFVYIGLHSTTATNALLLNSVIPVLIVLLSRFINATPITRRQAVGISISLCGVATIICRADLGVLRTLTVNRGDLWVLLAVVSWSIYTVQLKQRPSGLHPLVFLTSIIVIGLIPLIPLYILEFGRSGGFLPTTPVCFTILYVALFPSVLAFIFWNQAVGEVGAGKAGLFLHLMPVFGTILSAVFLGESIQRFHLLGIALIFWGIFLTVRTATANLFPVASARK